MVKWLLLPVPGVGDIEAENDVVCTGLFCIWLKQTSARSFEKSLAYHNSSSPWVGGPGGAWISATKSACWTPSWGFQARFRVRNISKTKGDTSILSLEYLEETVICLLSMSATRPIWVFPVLLVWCLGRFWCGFSEVRIETWCCRSFLPLPTTFAVGDTKQPWWFRVPPISGHTRLGPLLYLLRIWCRQCGADGQAIPGAEEPKLSRFCPVSSKMSSTYPANHIQNIGGLNKWWG